MSAFDAGSIVGKVLLEKTGFTAPLQEVVAEAKAGSADLQASLDKPFAPAALQASKLSTSISVVLEGINRYKGAANTATSSLQPFSKTTAAASAAAESLAASAGAAGQAMNREAASATAASTANQQLAASNNQAAAAGNKAAAGARAAAAGVREQAAATKSAHATQSSFDELVDTGKGFKSTLRQFKAIALGSTAVVAGLDALSAVYKTLTGDAEEAATAQQGLLDTLSGIPLVGKYLKGIGEGGGNLVARLFGKQTNAEVLAEIEEGKKALAKFHDLAEGIRAELTRAQRESALAGLTGEAADALKDQFAKQDALDKLAEQKKGLLAATAQLATIRAAKGDASNDYLKLAAEIATRTADIEKTREAIESAAAAKRKAREEKDRSDRADKDDREAVASKVRAEKLAREIQIAQLRAQGKNAEADFKELGAKYDDLFLHAGSEQERNAVQAARSAAFDMLRAQEKSDAIEAGVNAQIARLRAEGKEADAEILTRWMEMKRQLFGAKTDDQRASITAAYESAVAAIRKRFSDEDAKKEKQKKQDQLDAQTELAASLLEEQGRRDEAELVRFDAQWKKKIDAAEDAQLKITLNETYQSERRRKIHEEEVKAAESRNKHLASMSEALQGLDRTDRQLASADLTALAAALGQRGQAPGGPRPSDVADRLLHPPASAPGGPAPAAGQGSNAAPTPAESKQISALEFLSGVVNQVKLKLDAVARDINQPKFNVVKLSGG